MSAPHRSPVEVVRTAEAAAFLLEPTRRRILAELSEPDSASGLARRLELPRQRLNYHLRELERGGYVELVEERRKGNCTERIVRATARAFVLQPEALGAGGARLDPATGDRTSAAWLVAVASRAAREVAGLDERARGERKRLATLALDARIRFASAERRAEFAEELSSLVARLVARYDEPESRSARPFRLTALCHPEPAPESAPEPAPSAPTSTSSTPPPARRVAAKPSRTRRTP